MGWFLYSCKSVNAWQHYLTCRKINERTCLRNHRRSHTWTRTRAGGRPAAAHTHTHTHTCFVWPGVVGSLVTPPAALLPDTRYKEGSHMHVLSATHQSFSASRPSLVLGLWLPRRLCTSPECCHKATVTFTFLVMFIYILSCTRFMHSL